MILLLVKKVLEKFFSVFMQILGGKANVIEYFFYYKLKMVWFNRFYFFITYV